MLLHVMRHGPAEDRAPTGRDSDRPLTRAGRDIVHQAALSLRGRDGEPGHDGEPGRGSPNPSDRDGRGSPNPSGERIRILSSPFRRAVETAEIVAKVFSVEAELDDDLGADAGLPLHLVGELADAGTDALLVGHQPIVEALVRQLVHPAVPPLSGGFRTALIVTLSHAAPGFRLAGVVDPYAPR